MNTLSDHDVRRALMYCAKISPPYLEDLYRAALDGRISLGLVIPGGTQMWFEADQPQVVIISDDIERARGPGAFNQQTLVPLIERCGAASVITVAPERWFYTDALTFALQRQKDVVIIESRPEQEAAWLQFLVQVNPAITWGVWSKQSTGAPQ